MIKSIVLSVLILISLSWFTYRLLQLIKILRLGKPENRFDSIGKRIVNMFLKAFAQLSVIREPSGIGHFFIFMGFWVIQVGAIELFIQGYAKNFSYYQLSLDLFGSATAAEILYLIIEVGCLFVLTALVIALFRRFVLKPVRLRTRDSHAHVDATIIICLISTIILTIYGIGGAELALKPANHSLHTFMPVSEVFSNLFKGSNPESIHLIREILWWLHLTVILGFLVYIPYSKHLHLLGAIPNVLFKTTKPAGQLSKLDIEDEEAESFGVGKIEDYTWKQMLDFMACTECGRCQQNCPAFLTDKPLSPKEIIHSSKLHLLEKGVLLSGDPKKCESEAAQAIINKQLIGDVIKEDEIWSCTNCMNCQEHCPVFIEHIQDITDMRRYQVLTEGKMTPELQTSFNNFENNYNPYGFGFAARGDWLPEGLNTKTLSENQDVEYLYFVGCAASYDTRNQKIGTSFLKIMEKTGHKVGILGAEEACCGDSLLRLGNEYLYQMLVAQNIETFNNYGIKKIITTCPHCYNVIKKEYPKYGGNYEVYHHSEFLHKLIKDGKIKLNKKTEKKYTYHDSCFLGRYNNIYSEPREIVKAVPGSEFVELKRNHKKSFCCGAGGGRMWMEEHLGKRINQARTEELKECGAESLLTACPFCMTMLSDGITELGLEEKYNVQDLVELIEKSME